MANYSFFLEGFLLCFALTRSNERNTRNKKGVKYERLGAPRPKKKNDASRGHAICAPNTLGFTYYFVSVWGSQKTDVSVRESSSSRPYRQKVEPGSLRSIKLYLSETCLARMTDVHNQGQGQLSAKEADYYYHCLLFSFQLIMIVQDIYRNNY